MVSRARVEEVRLALEGVNTPKSGGREAYRALVHKLSHGTDPEEIRDTLLALGQNAALLSKWHVKYEDLLQLIFAYDWSLGNDVSAAHESIFCGLVSSNAGFLEPVFQLLVSNFFPLRDADAEGDDDEDEDEEVEAAQDDGADEEEVETLRARSERIHFAIKSVLRIIPLGCSSLLPVLIAQFPRPGEPLNRQSAYIREVLRVCDYVPVLRDRVLALVVDRMLLMDTEIRLDDFAPVEERGGEIFTMEDGTDQDEGDGMDLDENARKKSLLFRDRARAEKVAEKLDRIMLLVLDYCDKQLTGGRRVAKVFFELMLNIFDRMILPTRTSKFVPFIHFYICRKRADFVDCFVERLLQRALGNCSANGLNAGAAAMDASIQLCAASYLASFIARGLYIRVDSTQSALQHMVNWLHAYADGFAALSLRPRKQLRGLARRASAPAAIELFDPTEHRQFYAVCQATVYILMFKGEDITVEGLQAMKWSGLVGSDLDPFFYFSSDIVEEFSRFAKEKGLIDDEAASHLDKLGDTAPDRSASAKEVAAVLAGHYPFDPCLLRRTAEQIEPYYQHWLSKQGDEHAAEYERCGAAIDQDGEVVRLTEEEREHARREQEELLHGQEQLPPPIHIAGLSDRAARMLNQLGAGFGLFGNDEAEEATSPRDDRWGYSFAPSSFPSSVGSMTRDRGMSFASTVGSGRHMVAPGSASSRFSMASNTSSIEAPPSLPFAVVNRPRALSAASVDSLAGSW